MPRRSHADLARLADLVAAQRGLVTTAQLRELGLPSSAVNHRIRPGGPWTRVLPAVYLTTRAQPDRAQQRAAATLYCGERSVLTGVDALELLGVRSPRSATSRPVLVLLDHAVRRNSVAFVEVERTRRLPVPHSHDGHLVAPLERAVVDLSRRLQDRDDVTALVARAIQNGGASVQDLRREVAAAPIRHTALIREAVTAISDGVASAPEAALRRLWLTSSLPAPLWNPDLFDRNGTFIARPDAYVPEVGLAIEVESRQFHFAAADWERTMKRQGGMTSHGITVLQYPPNRLSHEPEQVLSEIAATQRVLSGRPTPDVVVRPQPHA